MIRRTRASVIVFALLFGFFTAPTTSAGQTPGSAQDSDESAGRFRLVPEPDGTMFLMDSATGRVWRYSRIVDEEEDPVEAPPTARQALLERRIEELVRQREEEAVQRTGVGVADFKLDEWRREIRAEFEVLDPTLRPVEPEPRPDPNPCTGTAACFVEVDRVRLTPAGWVSEILPNP